MTQRQTRQHVLLPGPRAPEFVTTFPKDKEHYFMTTHLKKITLTVLPLAGLLFTAPLTFAHEGRGQHGRVHNEVTEEHQQGHEALALEARASDRYYHSKRARHHEQRRLRREHQRLHRDLNTQHEDYHDGNRYPN